MSIAPSALSPQPFNDIPRSGLPLRSLPLIPLRRLIRALDLDGLLE